jgi:hypothetical protein
MDQNARATLRLIPRIDYAGLAAGVKRKRAAVRPQQKLFDYQEISDLTGAEALSRVQDPTGVGFLHQHRSSLYTEEGFLIKDFNTDSLKVEGINPSLEEIERFKSKSGQMSDDDVEHDSDMEGKSNNRNDAQIAQDPAKLATFWFAVAPFFILTPLVLICSLDRVHSVLPRRKVHGWRSRAGYRGGFHLHNWTGADGQRVNCDCDS